MRRVVPALLLFVFGSYFAWDQVERRALARDIDAIAARGEPITAVSAAAGADTAERHDAARIYAAAAARVAAMPSDLTYRLARLDLDATVGPPLDLAGLERLYRPDAPALQLLDQATPLDFNGFGDVPEAAAGSLMSLNYLAAVRADIMAARGRGDDAARALVPCARLWRVMPIYFRAAVPSRLLGSLRILLRHSSPSGDALATLQAAVDQMPDEDGMAANAVMQRAAYIDAFSAPRQTLSDAILARLLRPWLTHQQRRGLASFEDTLAMARDQWPQKYVRGVALEQKVREGLQRGGPRMLQRLVPMAGIGLMGIRTAGSGGELAARRVILATLAIERYRRDHADAMPPSLASLVPGYLRAVPIDPFSGDALVYMPTSESYRVYSVDTNRRNDGGTLYGFGSKGQLAPRPRDPHDLGIAVDVRR